MDKPQHQDLFYWKEGGKTSGLVKRSPGPIQWLLPAVTAQHPKKQQEPSLLSELTLKALHQVLASHSTGKRTLFWNKFWGGFFGGFLFVYFFNKRGTGEDAATLTPKQSGAAQKEISRPFTRLRLLNEALVAGSLKEGG